MFLLEITHVKPEPGLGFLTITVNPVYKTFNDMNAVNKHLEKHSEETFDYKLYKIEEIDSG